MKLIKVKHGPAVIRYVVVNATLITQKYISRLLKGDIEDHSWAKPTFLLKSLPPTHEPVTAHILSLNRVLGPSYLDG